MLTVLTMSPWRIGTLKYLEMQIEKCPSRVKQGQWNPFFDRFFFGNFSPHPPCKMKQKIQFSLGTLLMMSRGPRDAHHVSA